MSRKLVEELKSFLDDKPVVAEGNEISEDQDGEENPEESEVSVLDEVDSLLGDEDQEVGDLEEMKVYEVPRRKADLDEKTPANLKKRVALLKSAAKKVEGAIGDLAKIPKLDFMGDIPHFSEKLHDALVGEGAGSGTGLVDLAKGYEKEMKK